MPEFSPAVEAAAAKDNRRLSNAILITFVSVVVAATIYNLVDRSATRTRTSACLNNEKERFVTRQRPIVGWIKQHLLYAPLFGRRHSKPMRIGALGAGVLPSRLQSLLLFGIIVMNVVLAVYGMEWHGELQTLLLHLRNRSGSMAVTNMIPLILIAGRNNPLIILTNMSFNTYNLLHRWLGRIVASLATVHAVCEIYSMTLMGKTMQQTGLEFFRSQLQIRFILWGFIAFVAMCTITLTGTAVFRHAFYETFLHIHIALVALILAGLWIHLEGIIYQTLIKVSISFWALERLTRLGKLIYRNTGRTTTRAHVKVLPGDAVRVTLRVARPWTFKPGQHVFLTIPSVGFWTSHPFSVAWSDYTPQPTLDSPTDPDPEKALYSPNSATTTTTLPSSDEGALFTFPSNEETISILPSNKETLSTPPTTISLILRRKSGFTATLHKLAHHSPDHPLSLPALLEGPYGGTTSPSLTSYGTLLLFAGGVGITHQIPYIRHLLASHTSSGGTTTTATTTRRRIILVWVIQSPDHLDWIRPWMTDILAMPHRRDVLRIQLYVTRGPRRSQNQQEMGSPSRTAVQMFVGKPSVGTIVEVESRDQVGGVMGVSVCGPGGLADDVRDAVRGLQGGGRCVEFLEEGFC